jgi:hypothetical protein
VTHYAVALRDGPAAARTLRPVGRGRHHSHAHRRRSRGRPSRRQAVRRRRRHARVLSRNGSAGPGAGTPLRQVGDGDAHDPQAAGLAVKGRPRRGRDSRRLRRRLAGRAAGRSAAADGGAATVDGGRRAGDVPVVLLTPGVTQRARVRLKRLRLRPPDLTRDGARRTSSRTSFTFSAWAASPTRWPSARSCDRERSAVRRGRCWSTAERLAVVTSATAPRRRRVTSGRRLVADAGSTSRRTTAPLTRAGRDVRCWSTVRGRAGGIPPSAGRPGRRDLTGRRCSAALWGGRARRRCGTTTPQQAQVGELPRGRP